ncbi:MAG: hypothetical protein ACFCVA_15415 [Gammaproteobacteria bacterium]
MTKVVFPYHQVLKQLVGDWQDLIRVRPVPPYARSARSGQGRHAGSEI